MSVAVIMRGRKRSDINASLRAHQIRENEKDAKKILKDTASQIDPKLSHMNKNYFDDPDRLQEMRDKIDTISKKRQDAGGKKVYKSANVFMVGTLQIGDDSLAALGWKSDKDGKKLPADKQSPEVLSRVETVYDDMLQSVKSQPEIYGDIFSATLHMDEGSPHIDFMSDPLDTEKPDRLARHFMNGPKGTPRGHNLSVMQDNIMKNSKLSKSVIEGFDLVRGDGTSERMNTASEIRAGQKKLDSQKKQFAKHVIANRAKTEEFKEEVQRVNEEQARKGSELDVREFELDSKANTLNKLENDVEAKNEDAETKLDEAKVKDAEASSKLLDAMRLVELSEKLKEAYNKISDGIRRGMIRPLDVIEAEDRVKNENSPYDSTSPEHLEAMNKALIEALGEFGDDDLKGLEDADSRQL